MKKFLVLLFFASIFGMATTNACTNFLVTPGASVDGSSIVSYNADSHQLYGELYFYPRADWPAGSQLAIYEWDTGKYLGQIDQVAHTYQVIGNENENQVIVGETTYGGRDSLQEQDVATIDYGSLIYISLQRSKTAREAIQVFADLMAKYGYASEGESFSIADPNEVWILEVIGKGNYEKGAVWVARRIPDGYICAHANQARITTFEYQKKNKWNDPKATVFNSADVITFARKRGYFKGKDNEFSFSDVYAPVGFEAARFCENRVWSFFKSVSNDVKNNPTYFDYIKGDIKHDATFADGTPNPNGFASNRMPLWIKPDKLISANDVMNYMRDHLEGTPLDMTKDLGAGPFGCPYRWRPLTFEVDGKTYVNERATGTQQTGFTFVAQARKNYPNPIGGLFWFGVDDAASTVYVPIYCGISQVPSDYAEGTGSMIEWNDNSAFWTFTQVSNLAYTRYNVIHPEIEALQQKLENGFAANTKNIDETAKKLYAQSPDSCIKYLTNYSVTTANNVVSMWKDFYHYLFMKYKDGNIMKSQDMKLLDNGNGKNIPPMPDQPGYGEKWERYIMQDNGKMLIEPKE